jgi:Family of unknown function (DUF5762)
MDTIEHTRILESKNHLANQSPSIPSNPETRNLGDTIQDVGGTRFQKHHDINHVGESENVWMDHIDPPFWTTDPNILLNNKYIFEWFPTSDMTFHQKLNAVTRLVLFATILVFFLSKSMKVLLGCLITIGSILLLDKYHPSKKEGFHQESDNMTPSVEVSKYLQSMDKQYQKMNIKEMFDTPTTQNPLCNILLTDYEDHPQKKPAPPSNPQDITNIIKSQMDEKHPGASDKLFTSLYENFQFEQSLRPFHSMPSTTIPNDQSAFLQFCYGGMTSCKEGNLFSCVRNNAMKYNLY